MPRRSAAQAPVDNVKSKKPPKKRTRVSGVDGDDPQNAEPAKVAKKARWQPKPGKLADLMNLPMDILFEIFGRLNPLDILRLTRTTKQFRHVLMHRSSMSVWKAARENVPGMPDCPIFWSEPFYANLAFDPHCHECGAPGVRNVDWRIGRRICSKCSKRCMIDAYFGESVISGLLPSKYGKRGLLLYYYKDVKEVQEKMDVLKDKELEAYRAERRIFVKEIDAVAKALEVWAASQAKDRSDQLDDARRARKTAIIERLTDLGWGNEIEHIPYSDDLSHHRLVKQPTRLTPRIWNNIKDDMIKYMEEMRERRLGRERKTLLVTRKRIAIGVLRNYKIARLPLTDVMPEPVDFCNFPEVVEIIGLPTDTEVTEASFADVASRMDDLVHNWRTRIHSQLRSKVKDHLSYVAKRRALEDRKPVDPYYEDYLESLGADIKGKKKEVLPPLPDDAEIDQSIPLATTVFRCKSCFPSIGYPHSDIFSDGDFDDIFSDDFGAFQPKHIPLFYPKVMGHGCLTKSPTLPWDYPINNEPNFRIDFPMGTRTKWDCHPLQVDEESGKAARGIVEACGEDPLITTATKMDELDPRFACVDCVKWSKREVNEADAPVFTWRQAVQHGVRSHRNERGSAHWLKLEGELLEEANRNARQITEFIHQMFDFQPLAHITDPASAVWLCAHCMDLPQEKECYELGKVKNHLLTGHSINEPVENQDYYKDYEAPQGRRQERKLSSPTVTLQMERPSHIAPPRTGYCGFVDDDEDDDEDEDDHDHEEEDFYFVDDEDNLYLDDPFFPFY